MQKLMVKVQDEARAIKQLMRGELPKLEKQLAETTGLFKGKERKALQEKIAGLQQAPPEKESIRKKLRDMEAEAKRRNDARRQQTRPRSHDYDRGR